MTIKRLYIAIALLFLAEWQALAQMRSNQETGNSARMNRIDGAKQKYQELFGPRQWRPVQTLS